MKFKLVVLDLELTPPQKRVLGIVLAASIVSLASVALAGPLNLKSWGKDETLYAKDLNDNFSAVEQARADLDARVAKLEQGATAVDTKQATDEAAIVTLQGQVGALQALKPITVIDEQVVDQTVAYFSDCTNNNGPIFPQGACERMAWQWCVNKLGYRGGWFEGDLSGSYPIVACVK